MEKLSTHGLLVELSIVMVRDNYDSLLESKQVKFRD